MAKTGPLGKAEAFYVEEKFKSGESVEQIATDLDRASGAIEKHIKKSKVRPKTIIEQQFVRQSGATIMTENASSMIDQGRKASSAGTSNCIAKIK